jgi:cytidine deaminase
MTTLDPLFEAARKIRENAYVPYSNFAVGAAILTGSGTIIAAANVENAAYPQGQCAEASAIGAMIAAGERRIAAVMVVGGGDALVTPCGGCRQRIREFAAADTPIHIASPEAVRATFTMDELLPHSFGPENLSTKTSSER